MSAANNTGVIRFSNNCSTADALALQAADVLRQLNRTYGGDQCLPPNLKAFVDCAKAFLCVANVCLNITDSDPTPIVRPNNLSPSSEQKAPSSAGQGPKTESAWGEFWAVPFLFAMNIAARWVRLGGW